MGGFGSGWEPNPSPYCGRLDDHEPHPWSTPDSRRRKETYHCPGPPLIEGGARGLREGV